MDARDKAMRRRAVKPSMSLGQALSEVSKHLPETFTARLARMGAGAFGLALPSAHLEPLPEHPRKATKQRSRKAVTPDVPEIPPPFSTYSQLAERWGVSWGTVQNWLRAGHVPVLDRAPRGKRGKKVVARKDVLEFEKRNTKRLR